VTWPNLIAFLGVLASLTVAGVTVFRARTERRVDRATIAGEWAIQMIGELPDAILRVAADERIVYANVQASLMTKFHTRELVGMNVNDLIPARFRKQHPSHMRGYRNSPRTRAMGTAGTELYMLDKRGEETRVLIYLKQMEPIDNGPETLVVMRDYNEQAKLLAATEGHTVHQ
jgi:PAS domain S-box-containing protein